MHTRTADGSRWAGSREAARRCGKGPPGPPALDRSSASRHPHKHARCCWADLWDRPGERPPTATFCRRHRGRLATAAAAPLRLRGERRGPGWVPCLCADPAPRPRGRGPTGGEPAGRAAGDPVRSPRRAHRHSQLLLVLPLGRLRLAARQPLGRDHEQPRVHPGPAGVPHRGAGGTPRPASGPGLLLFAGPLATARQLGWTDPYGFFFPQSPNLFWPQDHAWCVASEIDLFCTLVGGSNDLAEALIADPRLDAWPVQPDDPIAFDSDQLNT
jgi:hypothetical protein